MNLLVLDEPVEFGNLVEWERVGGVFDDGPDLEHLAGLWVQAGSFDVNGYILHVVTFLFDTKVKVFCVNT